MTIDFKHHTAAHCETGVVSNMLNFYGQQLSEPMIFGIGSGLTFIYIPLIPYKGNIVKYTFRIFPGAIFSSAMKRLGVKVAIKRFSSKEKGMAEMDKLISKGIPVGNVVGIYHLSHAPVRLHFNAHNLCVVGKENDEYVISDPCWHTTLLNISSDELRTVRFAEGAFKPRGKMYWIKEKPTALPDLSKAIIKGIKTTCRNMVGIPLPQMGVRGIVTLSKNIRTMEKKYGEKDAMLYLATLVQMLEEIGTGGAGYRYMYGLFLHEAADVLNDPKLKDYSAEMSAIGDLWRSFALECVRKFKNRSNISYDELADMLVNIAAEEKKFFIALQKYVLKMNR